MIKNQNFMQAEKSTAKEKKNKRCQYLVETKISMLEKKDI